MRRKITNETWEQIKTAFFGGFGLRPRLIDHADRVDDAESEYTDSTLVRTATIYRR